MPFLQLSGITKRYPGVVALDDVDLAVESGSIHGLVGENGAGKSTLLKVLGGATRPDAGEVTVGGRRLVPRRPADALDEGVLIVHQELQLVPHMSCEANIFLGMELGRFGFADSETMASRSLEAMNTLGLDVDPRTPVNKLSIARRQMVELARALVRRCSVVALDEPTATLTPHEVEHLFEQVRALRDAGTAVVFVSHRLDEIRELCDTVSVLRDGRTITSRPVDTITDADLINAMVGRPVEYERKPPSREPEETSILTVSGLTGRPFFTNVSFDLSAGEILGVAGLVGSGRSEVARAIAGIDRYESGTMTLKGIPYRPSSPGEGIGSGVVYVSEDRQRDGLVPNLPVRANTTLASLSRFGRWGFVDLEAERDASRGAIEAVELSPPKVELPVTSFSGGNQQKIVLSRWLMVDADVIIFDEPTRGVDVGAKVELHRQIRELADAGKAIVVISSELPEVMALADRILVMHEGSVTGCIPFSDASPEVVMELALQDV